MEYKIKLNKDEIEYLLSLLYNRKTDTDTKNEFELNKLLTFKLEYIEDNQILDDPLKE